MFLIALPDLMQTLTQLVHFGHLDLVLILPDLQRLGKEPVEN